MLRGAPGARPVPFAEPLGIPTHAHNTHEPRLHACPAATRFSPRPGPLPPTPPQLVYGEASATAQESITARCRRVALELIAEDVDAVAGPPSSACTVPAAEEYGIAGVPQV